MKNKILECCKEQSPCAIVRMKILFLMCSLFLLTGCPSVKSWNPLPENASQQLCLMLEEKDDMLLIPILICAEKVQLGTPSITRYPFQDLKNKKFTSKQAGIGSPGWGVGYGEKIVGFLLISTNGVIYDLDTVDLPDVPDSDIVFHRLIPDAAQQQMLKMMLLHPEKWNNSVREDFKFPSLKMLSPLCVTWQKPVEAKTVTVPFGSKIVFKNTQNQGQWVRFWKPFQEPDKYCQHHSMPSFSAEEVLFCHEVPYGAYDKFLCLSNHTKANTVRGQEIALEQALSSGKYKIIAYEPTIPDGVKWDIERESFLASGQLRRIAKKYKLPLVILSRHEKSDKAPVLPGIPSGIRQYWHCAECN